MPFDTVRHPSTLNIPQSTDDRTMDHSNTERTVIAEQKSNTGSHAADKDIGKNLSQELGTRDLDRRLDAAATSKPSEQGTSKAQDHQPAIGSEVQSDLHEAAASKQP